VEEIISKDNPFVIGLTNSELIGYLRSRTSQQLEDIKSKLLNIQGYVLKLKLSGISIKVALEYSKISDVLYTVIKNISSTLTSEYIFPCDLVEQGNIIIDEDVFVDNNIDIRKLNLKIQPLGTIAMILSSIDLEKEKPLLKKSLVFSTDNIRELINIVLPIDRNWFISNGYTEKDTTFCLDLIESLRNLFDINEYERVGTPRRNSLQILVLLGTIISTLRDNEVEYKGIDKDVFWSAVDSLKTLIEKWLKDKLETDSDDKLKESSGESGYRYNELDYEPLIETAIKKVSNLEFEMMKFRHVIRY
jgi:hypothetical protein